ncbi:hypothetical protein PYCC9005_005484 [Savitreella phatthalungensis]
MKKIFRRSQPTESTVVESPSEERSTNTTTATSKTTTQKPVDVSPSIRARDPEPEYKLSSVDPESGTFIPPSPPEKQSFLSRLSLRSARSGISLGEGESGGRKTSSSSRYRQAIDAHDAEDTGFTIPRASFDGYRRSFDIRPSMDELRSPSRTVSSGVTQTQTQTQAQVQPQTQDQSRSTEPAGMVLPPAALPPPGQQVEQSAPSRAGVVEGEGDGDASGEFDEVDLSTPSADQVMAIEAEPKKKHFFWQGKSSTTAAGGDGGGLKGKGIKEETGTALGDVTNKHTEYRQAQPRVQAQAQTQDVAPPLSKERRPHEQA